MKNMTITLRIDAEQFKSGVKEALSRMKEVPTEIKTEVKVEAEDAKKTLGDVGKAMAVFGLAVTAVEKGISILGQLMRSVVNPALEAERAYTKVQAAVRSTGGAAGFTAQQLEIMAQSLQRSLAIDADRIMNEVTAPLLTFTKVSGEIFEQAQKAVIDLSVLFEGDMKGAAIQLGKALQDPVQGISALTRVGVSFSDEQKNIIQTLMDTGKVAEAQTVILDELNLQFGGQAKAQMDTYGGQIKQMTQAWDDFKGMIGTYVLPVIATLASGLSALLQWINGTGSALKIAERNAFQMSSEFDFLTKKLLEYKSATTLTKIEQEEMKTIVDELNQQFPNYFGNIDLMASKYDAVKAAVFNARKELDAYLDQMIMNALMEDYVEKLAKIAKKKMYAMRKQEEAEKAIVRSRARAKEDPNYFHFETLRQADIELWKKHIKEYRDEEEKLRNEVLRLQQTIRGTRPAVAPAGVAVPAGAGTGSGAGAGSGGGKDAVVGSPGLDRAKQEYDRLLAELQKWQEESQYRLMEGKARELQMLADAHGKELAILGDNNEAALVAVERYQAGVVEIEDKYGKLSDEEARRISKAKQTAQLAYYEEIKFYDAAYYEWKRSQIEAELQAQLTSGEISEEQYRMIHAHRMKELDASKEAYDKLMNQAEAVDAKVLTVLARIEEYRQMQQFRGLSDRERELSMLTDKYIQEATLVENNYEAWLDLTEKWREEMAAISEKHDAVDAQAAEARAKEREDATRAYYEQVKFMDSAYYDWKRGQIEGEIETLVKAGQLTAEQAEQISTMRIEVLDKEKEAIDRLPLEELIRRYRDYKSEMSDTRNMGVAAWAAMRDGLIAFKKELEAFQDLPGVKELIAQIQGEIEIAQLNSGARKGNWFWNQVIGFDPDDPNDQARVEATKATLQGILASASNLASGMISLSQQRKQEDITRMEETAARENWTQDQIQARRQNIEKQALADEKKYRNLSKALAIGQATMNIAEGVTKALAMGPIIGPILAAVVASMGAVQIGIIRAQKFARGGLFRGKGGPQDDQNLILASDGEYIVNAVSTARYLPLLEAINAGGRAIQNVSNYYAAGGLVNGERSFERMILLLEAINMNIGEADREIIVRIEGEGDIKQRVEKHERTKYRQEQMGKEYRFAT